MITATLSSTCTIYWKTNKHIHDGLCVYYACVRREERERRVGGGGGGGGRGICTVLQSHTANRMEWACICVS